jgi:ATP/maltotriose-dependent transcriptional regulator MalT
MSGRLSSQVFVGRQGELAEVRAAYDHAAGRSASAVLVGGEAGVGKTRLLTELTSYAHDAGALVLLGRCADLRDADMPLLPIAEALAALGPLPARASAELEDAWRGRAPGVAVFTPALELLREAAASTPVLLAIDDVHWADRSTLDLLTFLLGRLRDERLMLVLTFRSDELDRRAELRDFLAEAGRRPIASRVELERLTRDELGAQLEGILEREPDPRLVEAVFTRSAGNPLFAEELVAAAAQEGTEGLPATLRDMLLVRIRALGVDAQAVVRAAAVGGGRVQYDLLAAAVDLAEPQLGEAIRAAILRHVLAVEDDALAFRHPLLQEAAYGETLPGERARLHTGFALALEDRPELAGGGAAIVAAEIAHHWWRAGDAPRALETAVQAGVEAERANAHAEAASHLCRALDLWDRVRDAECRAGMDRAEVLARAAESAAWSGAPQRAVELVSGALELVDATREAPRAALLHERRGFYLWWNARGEDAISDYERAVALMSRQPPSAEKAFVLAGLGFVQMLTGRSARSRGVCEQALEVARAVGAPSAEVRALATLGTDLQNLGERTRGIACLREARQLARQHGDPDLLANTAVGLSDALLKAGALQESVAVALEGADDAERAGLGAAQGAFSRLNASEAAFELGRWDLAERLCGEVLLGARVSEVALGTAHQQHGEMSAARGDFAGARDSLRKASNLVGLGSPPELRAYVLELEAQLALWEGAPAAASRAASKALEIGVEVEPTMVPKVAALGVRAEADLAERARARRDAAAAEAASQRARDLCDAIGARAERHDALRATLRAEVARAEGRADPRAWETAAAAWDERGTPFAAAYARWRLAESLLAGTRGRDRAMEALSAARETADRLGAIPLLGEIDALARRARLELPADSALSPPAPTRDAARDLGLTVRELEVLEHVASGQTNREIAADLFISARTAGVHVSHVLEKLGASTRTEAATAAHRLGLVP